MNTNEHKMNTNEHKMNTNEHKMNTKNTENSEKTAKNSEKITTNFGDLDDLDENTEKSPENLVEKPIKSKKKTTEPLVEMLKLIDEENKYVCDCCFNSFKTHASMRRHELHFCKDRLSKEDMAKEIRKLNKEKDKLYKQIDELIQKVGDTTNNVQNNIILNNYGSENINHLTDAIKSAFLSIPYGAIPKMIKSVHFNDEVPENKNIKLPNKNDSLVKIYKNNEWIYKDRNETINDLIGNKYYILDEHYDKVEGELPITIKSRFSSFKENVDDKDKEILKNLKKECNLVLLNNRDK
tara:strand:+ start:394 stop:1278 length:885 start_codon:yes stop_codon:yes gene_type:complete